MLCSVHAQSRQRLEAFHLPTLSGQTYGKGTVRPWIVTATTVCYQLETHHAHVNGIGALSGVLVQ